MNLEISEQSPSITNNRFLKDALMSGVDINMPKFQATHMDNKR